MLDPAPEPETACKQYRCFCCTHLTPKRPSCVRNNCPAGPVQNVIAYAPAPSQGEELALYTSPRDLHEHAYDPPSVNRRLATVSDFESQTHSRQFRMV